MTQENKAGLFAEFPEISTQQWEEIIHQDLKGADYEKKLIWNTIEGLKIRPYYRSEDHAKLEHLQTLPGQFPFVRGNREKENNWEIRQDIEENDPQKANAIAVDAIKRGAEAIGFNVEKVESATRLKELLNGINLEENAVHLLHSKNYKPLLSNLASLADAEALDKSQLKGSVNFDPLGYYVLYGAFYDSAEKNFTDALEILSFSMEHLPAFRLITVNGQHYHNAGAHSVQELAFALAQGNEYLATLTEKGISIDELAPRMQFTFSVGSNYFMEIAKLRAARILWAKIVEQYHPQNNDSMKMYIHAVTSAWNKSIYDPYVNMLRTTTEAMSVAIAGVDSLTVEPFDSTYKKADEFSSRVARNQQIVLKHESYFNKVVDPAAGSYYIDTITDQIADAAWKLFVEVEKMGGFVKAAEAGFIKEQIEKTCQKRDLDIAMRKQTFVGVNQYPNLQENMLDKIQPTAKLSDLAGLRPYRGVQAFEAMRMAVENHQQKGFAKPKVYLFTWGNLAMRKARATFATNFFGCAGYQIQEGPGVKDLQQGIEKALEANAQIVVFCSSDEEYADMAQAASTIRAKQPNTRVAVAGNPADIMEQLNEAGVQHYIHVRTNALETLQRFNDLLGIA